MPRRRRGRQTGGQALGVIQTARKAAADALRSLRDEIADAKMRLEELVSEERSFRSEILGVVGGRNRETASPVRRRRRTRAGRRRGPAKADAFFAKLPGRFRLDDVRRVAGRLAGVSLAQWSRSKKIRKVGDEYRKVSDGVRSAAPRGQARRARGARKAGARSAGRAAQPQVAES